MAKKRLWANGAAGGTALNADRLNGVEEDIAAALVQLAADPSALFAGAVIVDANGAPTSAVIQWPDKANGAPVIGTYSGTPSGTHLGAINAYTITRVLPTGTETYTQPAVTRDGNGNITNRPPITVT